MSRPKKVYQTPVIEEVTEVTNEEPTKPQPVQVQDESLYLIPSDGSVAARKIPSMEPKRIVCYLSSGHRYRIKKEVSSSIYGDFYLLDNGFYVAKAGKFIIK